MLISIRSSWSDPYVIRSIRYEFSDIRSAFFVFGYFGSNIRKFSDRIRINIFFFENFRIFSDIFGYSIRNIRGSYLTWNLFYELFLRKFPFFFCFRISDYLIRKSRISDPVRFEIFRIRFGSRFSRSEIFEYPKFCITSDLISEMSTPIKTQPHPFSLFELPLFRVVLFLWLSLLCSLTTAADVSLSSVVLSSLVYGVAAAAVVVCVLHATVILLLPPFASVVAHHGWWCRRWGASLIGTNLVVPSFLLAIIAFSFIWTLQMSCGFCL